MTLHDRLNLIDGEQAWRLEVWQLQGGLLHQRVDANDYLDALHASAASLLLEIQPLDEDAALIHRAGWPFNLVIAAGHPQGQRADALLPTGAGDEAIRGFSDAFSAAAVGFAVVLQA